MQPPDELRDPSRASGWLNKLLSFAKSNQLVEGVGYRLLRTTRGTALEIQAGGGSSAPGSTVQRFNVLSPQDDYVACQRADVSGISYGAVVNVAKPVELRVSSWEGKKIGDWTYSRTNTQIRNARRATYAGTPVPDGLQIGDIVDEVLSPDYAGGTEVEGTEPLGGTGVTVTGIAATWIDLNADARRWKTARTIFEVCKLVDGVQKKFSVVLDGGPPFLRITN